MDQLDKYFNSYAEKSPARLDFIAQTNFKNAGYTAEFLKENPQLILVDQNNYPTLHEALIEECQYRNIDIPACYIDLHWKRLGVAYGAHYAIHIQSEVADTFTKNELRALIAHETKHLYQHPSETPEESCLNEYDCDRAAVESTDYETIRSYVHKAMLLQIEQRFQSPPCASSQKASQIYALISLLNISAFNSTNGIQAPPQE